MAIAPKPLDFQDEQKGGSKSKRCYLPVILIWQVGESPRFQLEIFHIFIQIVSFAGVQDVITGFIRLMLAQSSQALPSKSHRDHLTVNWASESAKALFHETKLLLAPMKFPRPGLPWDSWRTWFGGKQTGRFGEMATALGHNIFYWLSRDCGAWKCVMIALPQQGHLSISFDDVQHANNTAITLPLGALQSKIQRIY